MNIEEIKERVNMRAHMKTLCNGPKFEGSINYNNAEDDVLYLLSIIEQAEKALINIRDNTVNYSYVNIANEALKAIRGG